MFGALELFLLVRSFVSYFMSLVSVPIAVLYASWVMVDTVLLVLVVLESPVSSPPIYW